MSSYRYVTLVKQTEYDPRNDIPPGQLSLAAGKHPTGESYTILDEENEGFRDIQREAVAVFEARKQMSEDDILDWATEQDEVVAAAKEASA